MNYETSISGLGGESLGRILGRELIGRDSAALGVVSAFVSVGGFLELLAITQKHNSLECRLLAGVSNSITHPEALSAAIDAGWKVRLGSVAGGKIFHPKLIVSGHSFKQDGGIREPSFAYIGSSNLTIGGLRGNVECGVITKKDFNPPSISSCFATLWDTGIPASRRRLDAYAVVFAERNRRRSTEDMEEVGVSDSLEEASSTYSGLRAKPPAVPLPSMPEAAAIASWAGLESFTGDYQFQVEFPQAAGLVLKRIIHSDSNHKVSILCTADDTIREMTYRFYNDNGMFRINIPNDTPGVTRARLRHNGIALLERCDRANVAAKLTILPPGRQLEDIVRRSLLLGTWGRTRTRNYGWF